LGERRGLKWREPPTFCFGDGCGFSWEVGGFSLGVRADRVPFARALDPYRELGLVPNLVLNVAPNLDAERLRE
jgi:hypothetical protein